VTTYEFIDQRVEELREFFKDRYGRRWLRRVRREMGITKGLTFFFNRERPSSRRLHEFETFAVSRGFKTSRHYLRPRERKRFDRLESLVAHSGLSAVCQLTNQLSISALCAMAQHNMTRRSLKDDVFPAEFLEKWVEEDRTMSPVPVSEAPESEPPAPQPIPAPDRPAPPAPATPEGGRGPRGFSLSGPRAIKKLSREELKKLVYAGLDLLATDDRADAEVRMAFISRLQRRAEKYLLEHELSEKLAQGKEI